MKTEKTTKKTKKEKNAPETNQGERKSKANNRSKREATGKPKKVSKNERTGATKKASKNERTNKTIMGVTYAFVALLLGIMVHVSYFMIKESEEVVNHPANPRQETLAKRHVRGDILARDGEVLARTLTNAEGAEYREYPYGSLFAHTVGYASKGRSGVELSESLTLLNSNVFVLDKIRNELAGKKDPGDNVITTLDVMLQKSAYEALGSRAGAVVVSDVSTGEILALVSKPDFDPNQIDALWDGIIADEESSVLLNRVTQGLYPPGSTYKIITALEYGRQNEGGIEAYSFVCKGHIERDGHRINCYHSKSHGTLDFYTAFAKSCNSAFADMGASLDVTRWGRTCEELLFNKELPLPMVYNKSSYVLRPQDGVADAMQTAIGQGKTQMTPIHLQMITSAIANRGSLMRPFLVARVENANGSVLRTTQEVEEMRMMTQEEAEFLSDLMRGVVQNGTASKLKGLSYTAAGKTGSAEFGDVKGESHAWFTGFAPAEEPKISVTVIVEGAGTGGDFAVPIAKKIFDVYFSK